MPSITFQNIRDLAFGLENVEVGLIEEKIAEMLSDDLISYKERIDLASLLCSDKIVINPEWAILSGRIQMWALKQNVSPSFAGAMTRLSATLSPEFLAFVQNNSQVLQTIICDERDYRFGVFAAKTLLKSFLLKRTIRESGKETVQITEETPNYLYLRVATFISFPREGNGMIEVGDRHYLTIKNIYDNLSLGNYSHASPTLFNAGCHFPQMASCFLVDYGSELEHFTKAWHDMAFISELSGGIGASMANVAQRGLTGGGRGIVRNAKNVDSILDASDQGGKRKGNGTMYCPMFHVDIHSFIELRDDGLDDIRALGLFYGVMVPNIFMRRVAADTNDSPQMWSLFCPSRNPELFEKFGKDFENAYEEAERKKEYTKQVHIKDLLDKLITIQVKKGMPFVMFTDHINSKSNQMNSGMVKCSNLCTEIVEVTSRDEIASCNLASINLAACVSEEDGATGSRTFDFEKLEGLCAELVRNLNRVIDTNYYHPKIPQIKNSNLRHRPLGIGVQGLANAFAMLDVSWVTVKEGVNKKTGEKILIQSADPKAKKLNEDIFECMYYSCLKASAELAEIEGAYPSFEGSPSSRGLFQMDMWAEEKSSRLGSAETPRYKTSSSRYSTEQWESLREKMKKGIRNSLLIALMPTATSAQILDNNEAFEVFHELISNRSVMSGQHTIVNRHMVKDLSDIGFWSPDVMQCIVDNSGSMSKIHELYDSLPFEQRNSSTRNRILQLQTKYLTVYEVQQKPLLEMMGDRSQYICQTSSMNIFMAVQNKTALWQILFYAWTLGLKTGMYYLRQKQSAAPRDMTKASRPSTLKGVSEPTEDLSSFPRMDQTSTVLEEVAKESIRERMERLKKKCQDENAESCLLCDA